MIWDLHISSNASRILGTRWTDFRRLKVGRLKVGFFNRQDFDIELIEFEKEVRPSIDEPEIVDRLVRNRVDILENFLVTKFMLALGDISPTILPDYSRGSNPEGF